MDRGGEIVLFAEPAVDAAGDFGGGGAFYAASVATEKNGESDFRMGLIGVSDEPADV